MRNQVRRSASSIHASSRRAIAASPCFVADTVALTHRSGSGKTSAKVKQPAYAAAINSPGFVPCPFSSRVLNE